MAKVTLSPFIKDIRGRLGDTVFRRSPTGNLVASKMPDMSNVKWSEAQKAHRERFRQAVAYAKAAMAEPAVRAQYEKAALQAGKRPFDLAVSDYFKGKDLLQSKGG